MLFARFSVLMKMMGKNAHLFHALLVSVMGKREKHLPKFYRTAN